MSDINPERIDADITPDDGSLGVAEGNPVAGNELTAEEVEEAVKPEDNSAVEVDGPTVHHA